MFMLMKRSLHGRFALSILSILLAFATVSCVGGSGSGDGVETTETAEPGETLYEPVVDADADSLEGITIRSADDLAKIGTDASYPLDGDYYLVVDIDISDRDWLPIGGSQGMSGAINGSGVFTGTFDGRGHTINGLTVDANDVGVTSYWGLFGTVGSNNPSDPAEIRNLVLKNVSVSLKSHSDTGVGALAGQVSGFTEIDSISLLSGSVTYNGNGNLGCGGLIGQCRTQVSGRISNNGISITNIFSNVTVTSNNGGWDTGGGIIGRIRDSALGELSDILLVANATSEGVSACAIASGDNTAKNMERVYFLAGTGNTRDGMGVAVRDAQLTNGSLDLSSAWTVTEGMYPLLTAVVKHDAFSLLDLAIMRFADGESIRGVKTSFSLPTSVLGNEISWSSGNESVISISDGRANVTQPEGGSVNVKLTADFGVGKKDIVVRVIGNQPHGEGQIYFITEYVEADKPIEIGGVDDGATVTWVIENYADNKSRTETTTEPRLTLGESDSESMITASVEGYSPISIYYSTLPVIYFESATPYDGVTSEYIDTDVKVCAPAGTEGLYSGKAGIKLRGNSTATLPKHPFKLKLDKKANLLGIDREGKSKHWCLLANAKDPTLMRNKLLMDFSQAIGTEAYVSSENVALIYNGEYCGVYQLTEHIRVGKTRVDVFDWEEYAEDAAKAIAKKISSGNNDNSTADDIEQRMLRDWSWMKSGKFNYKGKTYDFVSDLGMEELPPQTGGFLLEMDFYAFGNGTLASTQTAYAQPLYFNTPEPTDFESISSFQQTDLYGYAYRYVQSFEYALHSDDFFFRDSDPHYAAENWWNKWAQRSYVKIDYSDPDNSGKHYSELFDMDSLVRNFIFCEMAMNWDSMKNSFFVYKDVDELAKIGPQWDFDWAWGNVLWNSATWAPESWHCRDQVFMQEQYYQEVQWNCLLIRDPYFLTKVYEMWHELRDTEIEALVGRGGTINSYSSYVRRAALANDGRWAGIMSGYNSYSGEHYDNPAFDPELERMNNFVSIRMPWLDTQFRSIGTLMGSLGTYHPSTEMISDPSVATSDGRTTITCRVPGAGISYIMFQINGKTMIEAPVEGGYATVTVDTSTLDADGYNCVVAYARDAGHNYIVDASRSDVGNYNSVYSNYKSFRLG